MLTFARRQGAGNPRGVNFDALNQRGMEAASTGLLENTGIRVLDESKLELTWWISTFLASDESFLTLRDAMLEG